MNLSSAPPRELQEQIERLSAELALSETRFRDIIERNADAIVVVNQEGTIAFMNAEAQLLFGHSADLLGSPFGFPLVAGKTTELDLVREHTPVVVEMRVVETQWEGQPACIATLRDITERKRIEQRARDLIRAQSGQSAAEESARRFRFLAESSTILSSSLDYAATLSELAKLCVSEIADWVIIYTINDGELRRLEVAHRDPLKAALVDELRESPIDPISARPIYDLLKTQRPQLMERIDVSALEAMVPNAHLRTVIRELGIASSMLVPMVARERVLGAMALVSGMEDHLFTAEDLALATDLAARAALAVDNARLYEEARQANQTKTELLAIISHDLRTPLNSIIGYGQLLQMGIPEQLPEAALERINRMLTSAKHQLYLIDELLHFARLDARHEELQLESIDVRLVAREAASLIEPLAAERNLSFQLVMPDRSVELTTDPDKLRQMLLNLLQNAVRYTERGGITLELEPDAAEVMLRVRDTGIGISPEHLPHVFEPFWQVDRSQRTRGGGTGLGLSVVRQVCELLGGQVSVDSTPGQGTTFTIRLRPAST